MVVSQIFRQSALGEQHSKQRGLKVRIDERQKEGVMENFVRQFLHRSNLQILVELLRQVQQIWRP